MSDIMLLICGASVTFIFASGCYIYQREALLIATEEADLPANRSAPKDGVILLVKESA